MILFMVLAWVTGLIYLAFLIIVFVGLLKLNDSLLVEDDSLLPSVSVVVAARDEETRIGRLLDSLESQDYPSEKVEVIVVDDRSKDNTSSLVNHRKGGSLQIQVIRIRDGETPSGRSPKKYALSRGIAITNGEVIVTTDADCWMGKRWLRALVSPFTDPNVHGATGVSRFVRQNSTQEPWWSELESLEHLSYSVAAAGFISMDHVFNAHGSNLAARREIYDRIGGYGEKAKIISGDDVFLLQDIAEHGGKVIFVNRQEGYVYSQPVDTLSEWVNQRARWSSKGFYYPPFLRILVIGTFAFYSIIISAISLALTGKIKPYTAALFIMSKLVSESAIMKLGTIRFDESISLRKYLITQIIHPFAILYAGIRGQFFTFTWKGQKYSSNNKRN